ncbi:TetR/AcrR family transcriptional regulator [Streptomyces sp. RFCAC02]|uniref:TetR/AcrR family transcriptional regulator n=1 Tax=Streptomyces sp. RFCAC02 TaxID=2499143 RepID=UPI00101F2DFB|nr:TetR/AcrR family transcriptional regulator [Streptomyces sp. RFCAC02]
MSTTHDTGTSAPGTRLRADALRNRDRILAAARDSFARHGLDARLDEIARRAGVGNATLYRHFPDREALVVAVVLFVNRRITEDAERALAADGDPFDALRGLVLNSAKERVGGLCPILSGIVGSGDPRVVASVRHMHAVTQELVDRAHASGQLRLDVDSGDLLIAVSRLTAPVLGTTGDSEALVQRHLQIFIDGLRTPARSVLSGEGRTMASLKEELCRADHLN